MRCEEAAVVFWDVVDGVAGVDESEQSFEVLPFGVGDVVETTNRAGFGNRIFGQKAAVFTKGDKNDTVEEPLRHFDGIIEGELLAQQANQFDAITGVVFVELFADLSLAVVGIAEQLAGFVLVDQALAIQEKEKSLEFVELPQALEREMFVSALVESRS